MNQLVFVYPKDDNELYHHGVKGQSWGIRRYQNEDGTLTELGRQRLGYENNPDKAKKELEKVNKKLEFHKKYAAGPSYFTFKVLRKHSEKKAQQLEKRKNMLEKVKDFASDDMNDLKEEAAKAFDKGKSIASKALNAVGNKMTSTADVIKNTETKSSNETVNTTYQENLKKWKREREEITRQEKAYPDQKKVAETKKLFGDADHGDKRTDSLMERIFKDHKDVINKSYKNSWENPNSKYHKNGDFDFDKWQNDSCKALLRAMNLPVTNEGMAFLKSRIFTGDD